MCTNSDASARIPPLPSPASVGFKRGVEHNRKLGCKGACLCLCHVLAETMNKFRPCAVNQCNYTISSWRGTMRLVQEYFTYYTISSRPHRFFYPVTGVRQFAQFGRYWVPGRPIDNVHERIHDTGNMCCAVQRTPAISRRPIILNIRPAHFSFFPPQRFAHVTAATLSPRTKMGSPLISVHPLPVPE